MIHPLLAPLFLYFTRLCVCACVSVHTQLYELIACVINFHSACVSVGLCIPFPWSVSVEIVAVR